MSKESAILFLENVAGGGLFDCESNYFCIWGLREESDTRVCRLGEND